MLCLIGLHAVICAAVCLYFGGSWAVAWLRSAPGSSDQGEGPTHALVTLLAAIAILGAGCGIVIPGERVLRDARQRQ